MVRPPLDIVALFQSDIPNRLELAIDGAPPFYAHRLVPPFTPLAGHLADRCQPLTEGERGAAENARAAVLLRCDADVPPAERLPACVELMRRCYERGALALVLPAAYKIIGPSGMAAIGPDLDHATGWLKLFLQLYTVHDEEYAWSHTHGMEHLGLPDLECRTRFNEAAMGERLILGAIHHLMDRGGDCLKIGDFFAAAEDDDSLLSRFWIYAPREVADHQYGAYGALQLVPDPRPCDSEGNIMDPRSQLMWFIERRSRVGDLDFQNAELAGAELAGLEADGLDLRTADLRGAKLCEARLGNCRFDGAKLQDAELSNATLHLCVLDGAEGAAARFDDARFEDSSAKGADLSGASLRGAHLTETSFARAILREAVLDGAEGDGVEFRGADLCKASLVGARLDEADFRGADLTGADLSRGRFHSADFRGAILDAACFDAADCRSALFDDGDGPPSVSPPGEAGDAPLDAATQAALSEMLAGLQSSLAAQPGPAADLLQRLRQAMAALETVSDEPPEAWRPWLEPLVKMTNGEQPFNLQILLDALAALGQPPPRDAGPPAP